MVHMTDPREAKPSQYARRSPGSILLEGGQHGVQEGQAGSYFLSPHSGGQGHGRTRSATVRLGQHAPTSPGPQRSPTDTSLT